jgi:hypothetical protein
MRTLSAALLEALRSGGTPDLKLELADVWPHFGGVASGMQANGGPCAACIAPDGALLAAYVRGTAPLFPQGSIAVARVSDPTQAAAWSGWTTLATDGREEAGICFCCAGGLVRVLWQAGTTTAVLACDSMDSGQTWSAATTLFDPGYGLGGIAADGDPGLVLAAYDPVGLGAMRVAAWTQSGAWTPRDWPHGDLNAIAGLAAVRNGDGSYALALAGQGVSGAAYGIQSCVYGPGATWSDLSSIQSVDLAVGLVVRYPHLTLFDGAYRLCWQIADSGSVSGLAYTRVARAASADFVHWEAGLEDEQSFPHGAAWVRHAAGQALVAAEAVRWAPAYDPVAGYRDLTEDIVALDLHEREGAPAQLVVTLDNSTGVYSTLPIPRPNACLLLSQGYAGAGLAPTHLLYLEQWTFVRAVDEASIVLVARDRTQFLARQVRYPLTYANRSVAFILADLAAQSGFAQPAVIDAAAQFAAAPALFQVAPGQTYLEAVDRLLALYDGGYLVRTIPGAGMAFGAVEALTVVSKSANQAGVWAYGDELEHLQVTQNGDRANHLVVYGPQKLPTALAEVWDFADLGVVGQERYALMVEQLATSAGMAALAASLALAREQRLATQVMMIAAPHPGIELYDVVTIADSLLPNTGCRIVGIARAFHPGKGVYEMMLTGEGI